MLRKEGWVGGYSQKNGRSLLPRGQDAAVLATAPHHITALFIRGILIKGILRQVQLQYCWTVIGWGLQPTTPSVCSMPLFNKSLRPVSATEGQSFILRKARPVCVASLRLYLLKRWLPLGVKKAL